MTLSFANCIDQNTAFRSLRAVCLMAALVPANLLTGCAHTVQAASDPEDAITALLQMEEAAWNAKDNVTYASAFTDDADFMNIRGQIFTGRPAITQVHAMIFGGPFKGSSVAITVRLFKLLAPGVALVDTDQEVTKYAFLPAGIVPTQTGTLMTHFKYVAVQEKDGSWKFASGQNTAVLPN